MDGGIPCACRQGLSNSSGFSTALDRKPTHAWNKSPLSPVWLPNRTRDGLGPNRLRNAPAKLFLFLLRWRVEENKK